MIHCLPVKARFLMMIARGEKTVEVHLLKTPFKRIKEGDILLMFDSAANIVRARVKEIRVYKDAFELAEKEDVSRILPGKTKEELIRTLKSLYSTRELKKPFIAIEFEKIDFIPSPFEKLPVK